MVVEPVSFDDTDDARGQYDHRIVIKSSCARYEIIKAERLDVSYI